MLTLVIGGSRSGKSRFATSLCKPGTRVTFIATADASDDEMKRRILRHRRDRPATWTTVEERFSPARAVANAAQQSDFIIVDCLTLWLSNLCCHEPIDFDELEQTASAEVARLAASSLNSNVILVTNEVGCGIVPNSVLGRAFGDLQGFVNQVAAREAHVVYHMTAGIATKLKPLTYSMEMFS